MYFYHHCMNEDTEARNFPRVRQVIRAVTELKPHQLAAETTQLATTKYSVTEPHSQPSFTFYFGDKISLSFQG